MKKLSHRFFLFQVIICLFSSFNSYTTAQQNLITIPDEVRSLLTYTLPLPGSSLIHNNTNLAFRFTNGIDESSVYNTGAVKLTGSKGGTYLFTITKSTDNTTFILKPGSAFKTSETVTVEFTRLLKYNNGISIKPVAYSFTIIEKTAPRQRLEGLKNELPADKLESLLKGNNKRSDIPEISVNINNNPSDGYIFLSNIVFNTAIPNNPYLLVINNSGLPVFTKPMPDMSFDFNKQYNGNFTYYDEVKEKYYEVDSNFTVVDSFYTGNGYVTDLHELRVLRNRHALLMSYDGQIVDMSKYVPGGDTAAVVTGLIIQEIDNDKNVIFQWRSWDHFSPADATHEDLTAHKIDYVHGNAIEVDYDGNIVISSRHLDEITKININTGDIIWRLGGKNNQFTFINDTRRFSYQHAIRRIANGNITLYDNGNYHTPQYSRAIEYKLDEVNKTAELVWQYKNNPDIYGFAMGNVQRLENGNTLISWGATNPTLTEVKPDGSIALEIDLPQNIFTYRAFKYKLGPEPLGIEPVNNVIPQKFSLGQNYPNPFNPVTKISFNLPEAGYTSVDIYDILGRKLNSLVNSRLQAGEYEISFDASRLSSGVYYYRISSGDFAQTKKMMLIK